MRPSTGWGWVAAVGVAAAALIGWQRVLLAPVRDEVAMLRDDAANLAALRAEHSRLAGLQVSDAELRELRRSGAALVALRMEVERLRARLAEPPARAPEPPAPPADRLAVPTFVPAAEWKNAGSRTAPAALETALWAAAGGDVDAFASLLSFDGAARQAAVALLDSLPPETRARYGSPERLLAFLSIQDVPLGSARVRRWSDTADGRVTTATLTLSAPDGTARDVTLPLIREDSAWKLYVVERTVAKYTTSLKGSALPK